MTEQDKLEEILNKLIDSLAPSISYRARRPKRDEAKQLIEAYILEIIGEDENCLYGNYEDCTCYECIRNRMRKKMREKMERQ